MGRLVAIALSGLLGFASPVFAQSTGPRAVSQGGISQGGMTSQNGASDGLSAFGQDNTPPDNTALLIGGGLAIGGAALIAVLVSNSRNDNNPVSP